MAGVTSSDDTDSGRVKSLARSAGPVVLGFLVPWARPARAVVAAVGDRRRIRSRRRSPAISRRGRFVIAAAGGALAGGVAFSLVRRGRGAAPPIAEHPPRVEDVPTR